MYVQLMTARNEKAQLNVRLSSYTIMQIEQLMSWGIGTTKTETVTRAIDRLHQQERKQAHSLDSAEIRRRFLSQNQVSITPERAAKREPAPVPYEVYLINAEGTNNYKIGYSVDATSRRTALQCASPQRLVVVSVLPCPSRDKAILLEADLHRAFHEQRIDTNREWFELSGQDVEAFKAAS